MYRIFPRKEDYEDDTEKTNPNTDYSLSDNDYLVKKLGQITRV